MLLYLRPLWAYRGFILGSVKREFQSKYRTSILGSAWSVINPLAMILVYTVIFAEVMKTKLPGVNSVYGYGIYLCAGILTWGLFAEILGRGQAVFLDNANLLKKLNFPRLCLPVIIIAGASINFLIVFGLFVLFLLATGSFPGVVFFGVIPLLVILVLFAIGLGITLGVLNVFFRDVGQFFSIFLMFWFWLTPIVYTSNILSDELRSWISYNPMAPLMDGFQRVLSAGRWPQWESLLYPAALAVILIVFGMRLFRRHADDMVDEL
jgi:lipopolysaccharide transport system permease protein